ncbi:hypothetical protein [Streptomyces sp. NPDC005385]|uniref:hypothetical protein n=1 Tax=Streptomyces sp. NPDC005385 TaxID=3157039 RepID=UPI0033A90F6A
MTGGPPGVTEETTITAIRKTVTAAGCTVALLTTAAACGTVENLTAGQKVDRAVDRLGEQKSLSFRLDLDADADTISALGGDADPDEALPPEAAKALSALHVDVSVKSKKPLADSGEKDLLGTSLKVSGADGVLAEYRVVGDFTYYRADMKALGRTMGFPMPSADDLPPSEKEMKKVLQGDWVKIDTKALEDAQNPAGGSKRAGGAGDVDARTQKKILDAVATVIGRKVTFRTKDGADGVEHVVATGNFRALVTGVIAKLRPLQDNLPAGMELPTAKDLKGAPDKKVSVDFTLKNGDLRQIRIDLAALADAPKGSKLPLVLKLAESGDVSAPKGATELPADKFPGAGPGALGGGMLGGGEL